MTTCAACGHQPVAGPFCTRCGRPTAPAEPPPVGDQPPPAPDRPGGAPGAEPAAPAHPSAPTPGTAPPPPRFPLFADEADPPDAPTPARFPLYADEVTPPAAPPTAEQPPPPAPATSHRERRAAAWVPWVLGLLFVALIAATGMVLVTGGDDDPQTAQDEPAAGSDDPGGTDLTGEASARVPKPARASRDNQGNRVTYGAANLLDGDPSTCWRMPGDGTGKVLVFRFDAPVTLTEVGLINGYAKKDPPNDWYTANRRVLEVVWRFGAGDPVRQTLTRSRELQTVAVDRVETSVVRLRLVGVSRPGGRDFTAISDVSLRGE